MPAFEERLAFLLTVIEKVAQDDCSLKRTKQKIHSGIRPIKS